jgi:hypothetical protein
MADDAEASISVAVEQLALALGEAGAVPRGELIRALERAAERLRTRAPDAGPPADLLSQAEAARLIGVSRQTVNQWVRKGILASYVIADGGGRAPGVSAAELSIAANRGRAEPFSAALLQQLTAFLDALARDPAVAPTAEAIGRALAEGQDGLSGRRDDDAARVLREFLIAAMGTAGRQQEFTPAGVQMLAGLRPSLIVPSDHGLGPLLETLGLLVHSSDGSAGFDSPSAAILGLLGAATIGARIDGAAPLGLGEHIAASAAQVWGEDWVRRLFDAAYHADELISPPLTRYTAPLVYLGCNRFMRQAQADGISITYAASPGAILPQSYHGAPVLAEILAGRRRPGPPWQFGADSSTAASALHGSTKSPFRVFNFEYGLFDSSIHGIRRYCFSMDRAHTELRTFTDQLPRRDRAAYHDLAVQTLAHALQKPFVEMAAVESPAVFDWWKDHITRSSPRETVIGLRGERARSTAHALLVRARALPQIVESSEDPGLRERLRVYVKNLNYDIIDERYRDDLSRGITRVVKAGSEVLTPDEALSRAEREVRRMLATPGPLPPAPHAGPALPGRPRQAAHAGI